MDQLDISVEELQDLVDCGFQLHNGAEVDFVYTVWSD